MRYFVKAPDRDTYDALLERLDHAGVKIYLRNAARNFVSTDDLPPALIRELAEDDVSVSPEKRLRGDAASAR